MNSRSPNADHRAALRFILLLPCFRWVFESLRSSCIKSEIPSPRSTGLQETSIDTAAATNCHIIGGQRRARSTGCVTRLFDTVFSFPCLLLGHLVFGLTSASFTFDKMMQKLFKSPNITVYILMSMPTQLSLDKVS